MGKEEVSFTKVLFCARPSKVFCHFRQCISQRRRDWFISPWCHLGISQQDSRHPGGMFHVVDFYSRKQKRVVRSTFAAELQG